MEKIAPTSQAAEWDNVGLLTGDRAWPLKRVLLAIDLTPAVLREAIRARVDAILAYHPPIFRPTPRMVVDPTRQEGLAAAALAERIAIYSPHTALDAAPGGTNDTIAALAGMTDTRPFTPASPPPREAKLVTFVPADALERVATALFAAGAGRIGDYEQCSYRLCGEGTFFATDATSPAVGKRGRRETVEETRFETVVPLVRVAEVVAALRSAHPYEEPAFDVYPLATAQNSQIGQGRAGALSKSTTLGALARLLKKKTRATNVVTIGKAGQRVRRGLVCVGSAGSLPFEAEGGCGPGDVVITGEIRHHDALSYARRGATAIALGHWASERPVLAPLASRLRGLLPASVALKLSTADVDPFGRI